MEIEMEIETVYIGATSRKLVGNWNYLPSPPYFQYDLMDGVKKESLLSKIQAVFPPVAKRAPVNGTCEIIE